MDVGLAASAGVCLCVLARCAGFVAAATWPLFPGVCLRVRGTLAVGLAAAAMPAALVRSGDGAGPHLPFVSIPAEFLLGSAMGTAVACVTAAAAWAVGMMAAAGGVVPADAIDGEGAAGDAFTRLAWWIAAGGFLAAGGNRLVVGGLLDGFHSIPAGSVAGGAGDLAGIVWQLPGTAFSLAFSLALPALVAIVAFHATTAVAIRAANWSPGQGMLQSAAGLLLLGILYVSAGSWTTVFPRLLEPAVQRCFTASADRGD